jgi:ketosteroid isomerase-like protein
MKTTSIAFICLAVGGVVACTPPAGEAPAEITDGDRGVIAEQLFQMEHDWVNANETGEVSALHRIFADDFIYTVDDGTLYEKAAFIELAERDPIDYDSVRLGTMDIRWYGTTAVITGQGTSYWVDADGPQASTGQFTNVFVERDGEWKVVVGHSSPLP